MAGSRDSSKRPRRHHVCVPRDRDPCLRPRAHGARVGRHLTRTDARPRLGPHRHRRAALLQICLSGILLLLPGHLGLALARAGFFYVDEWMDGSKIASAGAG
jgi:hypothetical protein